MSQVRIFKNLARARSFAVRKKGASRIGVVAQLSFAGRPITREYFSDGKTFFGETDGGLKQFGQRLFAEAMRKLIPTLDRSGDGHGIDAGLRHFVKTFFTKSRRGQAGRRPTAGIQTI